MFFKKKKKSDSYTLYGGVSENVDYDERANLLYNHSDNFRLSSLSDFGILNTIRESSPNFIEDYEPSGLSTLNNDNNIGLQPVNNLKPAQKPVRKELINAPVQELNNRIKNNVQFQNAKPENDISDLFKINRSNSRPFFTANKHKFANIVIKYNSKLGADFGAKIYAGDEASENLKMAFADSYMNTPYARKHLVYENVEGVSVFLRSFVKDKIRTQLGNQYVSSIKGIFIDNVSESSKRLAQNEDIKNFIQRNKHYLKEHGHIAKSSIQFTDNNFRNAIGKADIVDMVISQEGDIYFYVIDTYDFNEGETDPMVRMGKKYQDEGRLIPYFFIYSVKIDKYTAQRYLQ